jgi:hypothetical protein
MLSNTATQLQNKFLITCETGAQLDRSNPCGNNPQLSCQRGKLIGRLAEAEYESNSTNDTEPLSSSDRADFYRRIRQNKSACSWYRTGSGSDRVKHSAFAATRKS